MNPSHPKFPFSDHAIIETYGEILLPIESLKDDADFWPKFVQDSNGLAKIFLSSGTTQREQSKSPFSHQGLKLYRERSLQGFWDVLGVFFSNPKKTLGWSLVPTVSQWPNSSLAQMVGWIQEDGNVLYSEEPPEALNEPIWVFATAFHLVNWADSGKKIRLPEGSVVIETGGTKGKSRSVTRLELYQLISDSLGVECTHIISEYGMCEMASQAYDYIEPGTNFKKDLNSRTFRFPSWVNIYAIDSKGKRCKTGIGTLCIDDPTRIDLPWLLRTEDLVEILPDSSFKLLGRVPYSPLKGCSLLAEQITVKKTLHIDSLERPSDNLWYPVDHEIRQRAERLYKSFNCLMEDPSFHKLLLDSLKNRQVAEWCLEDMRRSAPNSIADWVSAGFNALQGGTRRNWVLVLPRSHAIAGFHPLIMAGLLDLQVKLRAPHSPELLEYFCEKLFPDLVISRLNPNLHIEDGSSLLNEAILLFGSDETVAKMDKLSSHPIKGFGTCITASVASNDRLGDLGSLIWRESMSLGQEGCLSSRVLFVINVCDEADLKNCLNIMEATLPDSLLIDRTVSEEIGSLHAIYRWRKSGRKVYKSPRSGAPAILTAMWDAKSTLEDYLADSPWALPLVGIRPDDLLAWASWQQQQTSMKHLTSSDDDKNCKFLGINLGKLGQSNSPKWDGMHLGQSLFGLVSAAEIS